MEDQGSSIDKNHLAPKKMFSNMTYINKNVGIPEDSRSA